MKTLITHRLILEGVVPADDLLKPLYCIVTMVINLALLRDP